MDRITDADLVRMALEARTHAYAPYSRFPVGAALLAEDGSVHTGCNVECASFGASCCAERTAVVKAVSGGHRRFLAVAVVSERPEPCLPCGICRQVLLEFAAPGFRLLAGRADGTFEAYGMQEILPNAFVL